MCLYSCQMQVSGLHRLLEDTPAKQAYKEATENLSKKTKDDQKLTWHHTITKDLK